MERDNQSLLPPVQFFRCTTCKFTGGMDLSNEPLDLDLLGKMPKNKAKL